MTTPVQELKGITEGIVAGMKAKGISDNEQLVDAAATPAQRQALATDCGCDARDILQLANRADLARIKGVSGVYSDLLEHAGVDTVKELATRRPDHLYAKLTETNDGMGLTQKPPTAAQVAEWIAQSQALPETLTY